MRDYEKEGVVNSALGITKVEVYVSVDLHSTEERTDTLTWLYKVWFQWDKDHWLCGINLSNAKDGLLVSDEAEKFCSKRMHFGLGLLYDDIDNFTHTAIHFVQAVMTRKHFDKFMLVYPKTQWHNTPFKTEEEQW